MRRYTEEESRCAGPIIRSYAKFGVEVRGYENTKLQRSVSRVAVKADGHTVSPRTGKAVSVPTGFKGIGTLGYTPDVVLLEECDPVGITEYILFDVCVQGTEREKIDGWSGRIDCAVKGFEKKISFLSQGIPRLVCLEASEGLYELSMIGKVTADHLEAQLDVALRAPSNDKIHELLIPKPTPAKSQPSVKFSDSYLSNFKDMVNFGAFGCKTDGDGNAGLMISLGSRHDSNKVTMQSGCTYDFPSYGTSSIYSKLDTNAAYSKSDFTALLKLDATFACPEGNVLQDVKVTNSHGNYYLKGMCIDIIVAYKPAQYQEYSECFNPRPSYKLSSNIKGYNSMGDDMMKCKENTHAIRGFKVYQCADATKSSSWHQFRFVCQPLLMAKKNTPVLPYTGGKYSPTTTNALTFDKDLFLGDLTANIKFMGPVLKLADRAADPEEYTVETTTSGCTCMMEFSFGKAKYTEGCTFGVAWPVKWCASIDCGYADAESSTGFWDDCVPPQKLTAEPSDFIPAHTTVTIAAKGVRTVGAVPTKMLPEWVTESIISLTINDEKGISSIQVEASKGNQYTASVHAEVHFTAEGAGYSVKGTIPDVLYTGASVAAANNMNDYKFPWDTTKRVFPSFRATTQTFVAAGTVKVSGVASVESDSIEIDIKAATIKATSFMAKSIDFETAPDGEWLTRSSMIFNYPAPAVTGNASLGDVEAVAATSWSAMVTGFASLVKGDPKSGGPKWSASASSTVHGVKLEQTAGQVKTVRFEHADLDVDIAGFHAADACKDKTASVVATGTITLGRGVLFAGRSDGTAAAMPTVAITFPVSAAIACTASAADTDESKGVNDIAMVSAQASGSIMSYEVSDDLYLKDVVVVADVTVGTSNGGTVDIATTFIGKVDLGRSVTGLAFHYGELDLSFKTRIGSVVGGFLQSDFEEEVLASGSFMIETGPTEKPDMKMFVTLSEGVALPCPSSTKAPATGYVSIDQGMVRIVEANVQMVVVCGSDADLIDKPRVVAKSVLKLKALFDSAAIAKIYATLQTIAFDTVEVTISAIQGNNGWYWDMGVAFVLNAPITMGSGADYFYYFKSEMIFSSRWGLPSENAKIHVEIELKVPKVEMWASGSFVLGAVCRSSESERRTQFFGGMKITALKNPLFADATVLVGCPVYESDESEDYKLDYNIIADVTGYEIVKDEFILNNGKVVMNYYTDNKWRNRGWQAIIEGNITLMASHEANGDLPFDVGASATMWAKVKLDQYPNDDFTLPPVTVDPIEFNAILTLNAMTSTGDENSTDQSGFSLVAQVKGDYPCSKTIIGGVNLKVFIGQEMDMSFGLEGTITFYCGSRSPTEPKFEASVYASVDLDIVAGIVIDGVEISVSGFQDEENDSWVLVGTVLGKVVFGMEESALGTSIRYHFNTGTGYWSLVTSVYYTSSTVNLTMSVGLESGECTETGNFIEGVIDFIIPVPALEAKNYTVPVAHGDFFGVVRCGDAAVALGKYQLRASFETIYVQIEQFVVAIQDLTLSVDALIPEGKTEDAAFDELDFYVHIVGTVLLGMDFKFPDAELLNALTPQVSVDFYGELLGGTHEISNVNFTITTMLDYTLPAPPPGPGVDPKTGKFEKSWQAKDGLDQLKISAYVRVRWPCPDDGDMVNAQIEIEANFDYFNISKAGWCRLNPG